MFFNQYKNKKVLVTGHTGFKGSWLVKWLNLLGAEVCGYSLESNTSPSHFNVSNPSIESIIGNILNKDKFFKVVEEFQPEIVFHMAAQPLVRLSYSEPASTFETNVLGTVNVLEACRESTSVIAVVNITTDKCYENKEWLWGYREDEPLGGHDPYSASKACSEIVTASYRSSFGHSQFLLATARAGNVIGGGDWAEDRLVPDVIRGCFSDGCIEIRNPVAVRPWQHVLEPLSGYLLLGQKLLEGQNEFADVWNFGPSEDGHIKVSDVLDELKDIMKFDISYGKANLHEAGLLKLDCSKAKTKLGWNPVWNTDEMIRQTAEWYLAFYNKNQVKTEDQINQYVSKARKLGYNWAIQ